MSALPFTIDDAPRDAVPHEAPDRQRLLEALWQRGLATDAEAIERIRSAFPDDPGPAFLRLGEKLTLHVALTADDRAQAAELLAPTYWNAQVDASRLRRALDTSTCAVGVRDPGGRLITHARALSDNAKYAWIYDVIVAPEYRGHGLGLATVRLLLDHPQTRQAGTVLLKTRDAQNLYAKLGFIDSRLLPPKPYTSTEMVLIRR